MLAEVGFSAWAARLRAVDLEHLVNAPHVIRWGLKERKPCLYFRSHQELCRAAEKPDSTEYIERTVAGDDPLLAYALGHLGIVEIDRLQLDSPALQYLEANQVEIALFAPRLLSRSAILNIRKPCFLALLY